MAVDSDRCSDRPLTWLGWASNPAIDFGSVGSIKQVVNYVSDGDLNAIEVSYSDEDIGYSSKWGGGSPE